MPIDIFWQTHTLTSYNSSKPALSETKIPLILIQTISRRFSHKKKKHVFTIGKKRRRLKPNEHPALRERDLPRRARRNLVQEVAAYDRATCHPYKTDTTIGQPECQGSQPGSKNCKYTHQTTQKKLRWNQKTNPSKFNACCSFARQMILCCNSQVSSFQFSCTTVRGRREGFHGILTDRWLSSKSLRELLKHVPTWLQHLTHAIVIR